MTRKRFIRILMARGISRNIANKNTEVLRDIGWSYQRFYDAIMVPIVED